jgi:hypothetical protein
VQHVIALERALGNFKPLKRILTFDDFDRGSCGWLDLRPNFVGPGFTPHNSSLNHLMWGPPMLSTATFRFQGTHGSLDGTYSMKLTTRASADRYENRPGVGSMGHLIKRLSRPDDISMLQFEMWYAFKAEQDRPGLGENAIRGFGVFFDVQDAEHRYFPGVRYLNAVNGELHKTWWLMKSADVSDADWAFGNDKDWCRRGIDPHWYGRRYSDGTSDSYVPVPEGRQDLIYNETDGKMNWMYLRFAVDVRRRRYVELQSGDRTFDLSDISPTLADPYERIHNLINPVIFVETDTDRRVFLFVDSVLVSVE